MTSNVKQVEQLLDLAAAIDDYLDNDPVHPHCDSIPEMVRIADQARIYAELLSTPEPSELITEFVLFGGGQLDDWRGLYSCGTSWSTHGGRCT